MEWYGAYAAVNIQEVIRELLAVKANNEELTKRVLRLEMEVEELARNQRDRLGIQYLPGEEQW